MTGQQDVWTRQDGAEGRVEPGCCELFSGLPFTGSRPTSPQKNRAGILWKQLLWVLEAWRLERTRWFGNRAVGLSQPQSEWNGFIQRPTCTLHVTSRNIYMLVLRSPASGHLHLTRGVQNGPSGIPLQ